MNAHEREVLENFLNQLTEIRGVSKNPEADAIIARAIAQQPDASYLLARTTLHSGMLVSISSRRRMSKSER